MRATVNQKTGKRLHSWRDIADKLGVSHEICRRWHHQAIEFMLTFINEPIFLANEALPAVN